jgi:hypothetical protein
VDRIQLATGHVTESDSLVVELITTREAGEVAVIVWPSQPTRVSSQQLTDTIARTCRILSNSGIELAARQGRKRW